MARCASEYGATRVCASQPAPCPEYREARIFCQHAVSPAPWGLGRGFLEARLSRVGASASRLVAMNCSRPKPHARAVGHAPPSTSMACDHTYPAARDGADTASGTLISRGPSALAQHRRRAQSDRSIGYQRGWQSHRRGPATGPAREAGGEIGLLRLVDTSRVAMRGSPAWPTRTSSRSRAGRDCVS
jgi:hypothetical protein